MPRFPLACELTGRPALRGQPVALARPDGPAVWVASPAAERAGITAGQPLRAALGRCPALAVLDARPARYDQQAEALLAAVEQVVAGVEPGEQGVAYVDLGLSARSDADRRALQAALLGCVPPVLGSRLGVAPTAFTALVAAHHARAGQVHTVAEGQVEAFLGGQPVGVLPASDEMRRRLGLLGLRTLGALRGRPRSALVAQFGPEGGHAWDLAGGGSDASLRPRPHVERLVERLRFAEPLVSRQAVLLAARQALTAVLRQPARRGRLARQVLVRVETEADDRWQRAVTCKDARADRDRLWAALQPVLAAASLSGPVRELTLELRGLAPERGWQVELLPARSARQERLEESLRQLKTRYDRCPVGRVVQVEPWSRIPERRQALLDFDP